METNKLNFIRIVEANRGIIRSLCNAYYKSYEDQKDVFQDIVLQLWKSFDTFRNESDISTWIYRVSLNTILAKVRNEKRKVTTECIVQEQNFPHATADDDHELLNMILQSLKELDKAIVILFLEGYKNKEIAGMLNLTPTNISTRLNRIRTDLKAKLKKNNYEFKQP